MGNNYDTTAVSAALCNTPLPPPHIVKDLRDLGRRELSRRLPKPLQEAPLVCRGREKKPRATTHDTRRTENKKQQKDLLSEPLGSVFIVARPQHPFDSST